MSSMYDRDDTEWEAMRDASRNLLEQAWQRGIADAAQDLMNQLREAAVKGCEWDDPGDIAEVTEQWLRNHGVETREPEPYCNHDPAAVRNGTCECGTYVQTDDLAAARVTPLRPCGKFRRTKLVGWCVTCGFSQKAHEEKE